jgi:phenylalanyl-tRNA synthetase beta chain
VDVFTVTPPPYRFDLAIEEDLIEEVARLYGFERIPAHPPLARAVMRAQPESIRPLHALRSTMARAGYQELVNYSFVEAAWEQDFAGNPSPIKLLNPIASHLAVMRSSLVGSLVAALRYNLNRKAARVRVFELGRVFLGDATVQAGPMQVPGIDQPQRLGALAYGPVTEDQWSQPPRDVDFFDLKGDVEALLCHHTGVRFVAAAHPALHPGRSARVDVAGQPIGWIGELHPRLQQKYELPKATVVFELDADALLSQPIPRAAPVPRYPAVQRDVALWFDERVTQRQIEDAVDALQQNDPRLASLRDFRLFDVYRPSVGDSSRLVGASANALLNKEKSLAFRIQLQDTERTLSDADADADQGRTRRDAVRARRPEQARGEGHGRDLLRRDPRRARARRERQAVRASATSSCATSRSVRAAIPRPARRSRSARRVVTFHASQKLKALIERLPRNERARPAPARRRRR